jgi:branched-chain amino acid transport system permease protein
MLSVKPIVMAFLGGVGTVYGPVIGAVIFVALEELVWRNVLNFHAGILGIIIVLLLVFIPGGLGSFRHAIARLRAVIPPKSGAGPGDAAPARVLP